MIRVRGKDVYDMVPSSCKLTGIQVSLYDGSAYISDQKCFWKLSRGEKNYRVLYCEEVPTMNDILNASVFCALEVLSYSFLEGSNSVAFSLS